MASIVLSIRASRSSSKEIRWKLENCRKQHCTSRGEVETVFQKLSRTLVGGTGFPRSKRSKRCASRRSLMEYFFRNPSSSTAHLSGSALIKAVRRRRLASMAASPIWTLAIQSGVPLIQHPYSAMCEASSLLSQRDCLVSIVLIAFRSSRADFNFKLKLDRAR